MEGNQQKMREALRKIMELFRDIDLTVDCPKNEAYAIAAEALSAPPRNCDVGTAEEQEERYLKLKREHVDRMARCPAVGRSYFPDSLYWAQMPYTEEGDGDGE